MYKLICTDVDGTLVDKNGTLLDCDRLALKKAYESGVKIVIASGRYRSGVQKIADTRLPSKYYESSVVFNNL